MTIHNNTYKKKPYVPPEIEVTEIDTEGILGDSFTTDVGDMENGDENGGGGFIELPEESEDENDNNTTKRYNFGLDLEYSL